MKPETSRQQDEPDVLGDEFHGLPVPVRESRQVYRQLQQRATFLEAHLLQEPTRRADVGEAGLEQVEADEGGEPHPAQAGHVGLAGEVGQGQGQQDDDAGHDADDAFDGHGKFSLGNELGTVRRHSATYAATGNTSAG
jgi:hypothetical protein